MHEYNQWRHEESVRQNEEWLKQFEQEAKVQPKDARDTGNNKQRKIAWVTIGRWLIMAPVAVLLAYVVSRLALFVTGFAMVSEGYSDLPFWTRLYLGIAENAVLGTVLIFTAVGIAPSHKHAVAISFSALTLLLTGFLIYPMLLQNDYWALWGSFCLITSVVISTIAVYRRHR